MSLKFTLTRSENTLFAVFFIFLLVTRLFLRSGVLELDEAEQVLMAQQFNAGYANQPPLYSWMQYFVFQVTGVSLFSVALLKSLLLTGCAYFYYQICRLHCRSVNLAVCAALAWVLIPAISLDLIKDNTHSVVALLMANMTWFCFIRYRHLAMGKRILMFSLIIAGGFLSKFNYFLFLVPFLFNYWRLITVKERQVVVMSLIAGVILASPYLYWLLNHADIGLHAASKLVPQNKTHWRGFINLMKSLVFFLSPLLLLMLFFPSHSIRPLPNFTNRLLRDYHLTAFIFLLLVTIVGGFRDFETRWLIPIFFLTPLLFFSRLNPPTVVQKTIFITFCLLVQSIYLGAIVHRSYHGHHRHPLLIEGINQQIPENTQWLLSESYWLLANLQLLNPDIKIRLLTPSTPLPEGRLVLLWMAAPPYWLNSLAKLTHSQPQLLSTQQGKDIVSGLFLTNRKGDN